MKTKFTAQELAKETQLSIRTIRYYDEIGLLTPKIRMSNGRRYYGFKELCYLQEIISLKKMGFSLLKIRKLLKIKYSSTLSTLLYQKKIIVKQLEQLKTSLLIIENKINNAKESTMDLNSEELASKLENIQNNKDLMKYYEENKARIQKSSQNLMNVLKEKAGDDYYATVLAKSKELTPIDSYQYGHKYGLFLNKLRELKEAGCSEGSTQTQTLMEEHLTILQTTYPKPSSRKIYLAIRDAMYSSECNNSCNDELNEYIIKAMNEYSKNFKQ